MVIETENLPDILEELVLSLSDCIEIINSKGELIGFYIYREQGSTIELRYIFIVEKFRLYGFGKILFNDFLCRFPAAERVILWVFSENKAAINLYKKFQFQFDGLINYIYRCNK
jgi:RimJ/RimL family protein N-acetyltransferase